MAKGITEIIKDFKILHPKAYEKIYEKGRADAIDECIKTITNFCGGLPNINIIGVLEQLKEKI